MSCFFCGSVDRTDEHIYTKWMRNGLQALPPTTVFMGPEPRPIRIDTGPTIVLKKGICGGFPAKETDYDVEALPPGTESAR